MQRASEAWHLRVIGRTWQQIADECGYANPSNAHRAVMRFAGTVPDPAPDELRRLWRHRMELLWSLAVRDATKARPGALRAGVAIADRAAKLGGLDVPQAHILVTPTETQYQMLVERILGAGAHTVDTEHDVLELPVPESGPLTGTVNHAAAGSSASSNPSTSATS